MEQFYYLFDTGIFDPQHIGNAHLTVRKATKDTDAGTFFGDGMFESPARLYEPRIDNGYPCVLYDPDAGLFRCYYTTFIRDDRSLHTPLSERKKSDYRVEKTRTVALSYAESRDGIHWERPALHITDLSDGGNNNVLIPFAHGSGVMLDHAEKDPAKRYKLTTMMEYPGGPMYMAVSFSGDGLHWCDPVPWPANSPVADSHNFCFRDTRDNRFKMVTRLWQGGMRTGAMCESEDFFHWSRAEEVLSGEGFRSQIYSMPLWQQNGIWLSVCSVFHEGDREAPDFDLVDCELAYSVSGRRFERVAPGQSFIARGAGAYPDGDFDCGCIYACPPVEQGDRLFFYYFGSNGPHTGFRESRLARAYLEKDKFAYYAQTDASRPGLLSLRGFRMTGEDLLLLAERDKTSELSLEIAPDAASPCYEGFSFSDCVLSAEGKDYWRVRFAKDFAALCAKDCYIRIRFSGIRLFAVKGSLICASPRYWPKV